MRTRCCRPIPRLAIGGLALLGATLLAVPGVAQSAPAGGSSDRRVLPANPRADEAIQQEIDELKKRIEALEQQLAASRQAPSPSAVPEAQSVSARNGSRLQVSGFSQIRFTNVGSSTGDRTANNVTDFQVTRFRPRLTYLLDPKHFQAVLMLNASTRSSAAASVSARDAYLEYDNPGRLGYYARAGQQKIPYGWEVFREGDETRLALERARVFGFLFPDERDIGLTLANTPRSPQTPVISLGVVNGDGINRGDGDRPKSFAANAVVPLGSHAVVGGSVYAGTTTATIGSRTVSQVKQAYEFENRLAVGRLNTQLEYLWGRALGADLNGGYGQIAYNTGRRGNLFLRHDIFDPNENAPGDYWSRTSFGWSKDFTRQFRLTGEYDLVTNRALGAHPHVNTFGVQMQGNF